MISASRYPEGLTVLLPGWCALSLQQDDTQQWLSKFHLEGRRKEKALAAATSQNEPLDGGLGHARSEQPTHCEFLDSLPTALETAAGTMTQEGLPEAASSHSFIPSQTYWSCCHPLVYKTDKTKTHSVGLF